ncbi:chromatin-remodeling ATPase INO80-like [Photinus pyralis]|nr:chromatin-remodeling ATPase INO80-like [Photinus pyralis]
MANPETKKIKIEGSESGIEDSLQPMDSGPSSPHSDQSPSVAGGEDVNDFNFLDVEGDSSINNKYTVYNIYGTTVKPKIPGRGSSKRGRPRGSRRVSALGRFNNSATTPNNSMHIETNDPFSSIESSPSTSISSGSLGYHSSPGTSSTVIRRGPGRPRLKPSGPSNSGPRGSYRPRRPARPLPVPLPTDGGGGSNTTANSGYSAYLYDYADQPSDSQY